ncbi:hypothetical protein B0H19DRAFT_1271284 [Mycena capillaripes]|nr:hypothetical protein B0H19DRAFT_1271284 [Mycena capillaripes]
MTIVDRSVLKFEEKQAAAHCIFEVLRDSVFCLNHASRKHSSGGIHILTLLLEPSLLFVTRLRDHVNAYYASPEAAAVQSPLALLRGTSDAGIKALPALALITCARDPEWLKLDLSDSYEALGRRIAEFGEAVSKKIEAVGHNHVSLPFPLGAGQGEAWAEDVMAWMETL